MTISFKLNGKNVKVNALPNERLSNILRTNFELKSVKMASFDGLRGSDCILLDDCVVPSSLVPIFNVENKEIVTLEHFSTDKSFSLYYKLIMKCFKQYNVFLCGFCDAGKIFASYNIIKSNFDEEDSEFEAKIKQCYSISLCRCTVVDNLLKAIKEAVHCSIKNKRASNYGRK